ncbi:hypothetical protein N7379_06190 [Rhizobium pusense]|uniref:hypothetical protein n=1 Tax=Agrobacterium pusense TaxID=648995 RepID=UPI0024468DB3|nr:hypothetical protein [Agrobacterium pusense]MDH0114062.1 hypothetical protein [Agrobacterium pusense]
MDIAGSLSAVSSALGLVKELREIDVQFDKAEMKLKIAELTSALSDAKLGLVDVAEELKKKEAEIARLRGIIDFRDTKLVDRGQFRYFADSEGNPTGHPLCPPCEKNGDFLAVVQDRSKGIGKITFYCPKCKSNYGPYLPKP